MLQPTIERMWSLRTVDSEIVGIPNEAAIVRLVDAILLERNDEGCVQRCRYMALESVVPLGGDPVISLPAMAG